MEEGEGALGYPVLCSCLDRRLRRLLGVSVGDSCSGGVCVAASVGLSAHLRTYSWGTSLKRLAAALKKKKVNGTDWFPGPNMPGDVGRSRCAQPPWVTRPVCQGSRTGGPELPSTPSTPSSTLHRSKIREAEETESQLTADPPLHAPAP